MRLLTPLLLVLFVGTACTQKAQVDMQGHRGARGLQPENTIPAFLRAIDEGVTTLELDVVISRDKQVVVSHEPYMSASICTKPNGEEVTRDEALGLNLYQMNYAEISQFDCGLRGNPRFPQQQKQAAAKPLLSEMIKTIEAYLSEKGLSKVVYNIEIKSQPEGDGVYHPEVSEFSEIVKNLLDEYLPIERYTIQSFDFRVLQYWHAQYEAVQLVALIENTNSIQENIALLGFTPGVYSPYYKLLDKEKIQTCHELGMKVIPWTVNELEEIKGLIEEGVDGIITDYPNLVSELKK